MKVNYYFGARQTGKTTTGLFLLQDQPHAAFLTPYLDEPMSQSKAKYSSLEQWIAKYGGDYETLILDEYHYASDKDKANLLRFILERRTQIKTIYVFTTPKYRFSGRILDIIAVGKKENRSVSSIAIDLYNEVEFEVPIMSPAHLEGAVEFLYNDIILLAYSDLEDVEVKVDDANVFHNGKIKYLDPKSFGRNNTNEITGKFFIHK